MCTTRLILYYDIIYILSVAVILIKVSSRKHNIGLLKVDRRVIYLVGFNLKMVLI